MNLLNKEPAEFIKRVKEYSDEYTKRFLEQNQGTPYGYVDPPDPLFKLWFEQRAEENPNWLLALPYADGADADVKRYMRVTGVRGNGVDWRQFAAALAERYWREQQAVTAPPETRVF